MPTNEGSLSFTAPSPQFQMFTMPPQHKMKTNEYLNQSLPTTNPPPGFGRFDSGGFASLPPPPPPPIPALLGGQFPVHLDGAIHSVKHTGRLKFFDEVQNYGFLIVDGDNFDIFVHYDDLKDSKLSRDILRQAKTNYFLQFSFDIAYYSGKYKESKKAVNLQLTKIEKLGIIN